MPIKNHPTTFSELKHLWRGKTAPLDFDIIVQKTLHLTDRSQLVTLGKIRPSDLRKITKNLKARAAGMPLAYIFHEKEFYGYNFYVDKNVLIPRPETEFLVETALDIIKTHFSSQKHVNIIDVGTGSGNIAISLYKTLNFNASASSSGATPDCVLANQNSASGGRIPASKTGPTQDFTIFATDKSKKALKIAHKNAKSQSAKIKLVHNDLLSNNSSFPPKFDLIVANLPYVDKNWPWLNFSDLNFEPASALYAADHGLALINQLLHQAKNKTNISTFILLEIDPCQQLPLKNLANKLGYAHQKSPKSDYIVILTLQKS